jgi:hypothetical protein
MTAGRVDPERLVFVDEMGTNTSLSPVYAWSPTARRAYCSVPRNLGKNTALLSSMSLYGVDPSLAVDGPPTHLEGCSRRTSRRFSSRACGAGGAS